MSQPLNESRELISSERRNSARRRDFVIALAANAFPLLGFLWVAWYLVQGGQVTGFEITLFLIGYLLTMIGLEIGYHRYFAHRAFKTTPAGQLLLGVLGSSSFQGGVIWWVATHRRHHAHSDHEGDPHSPVVAGESSLMKRLAGFFHGHVGWVFKPSNSKPAGWERGVKDLFQDPSLFKLHIDYWKWGLVGLIVPTVIGALWYQSLNGAWSGFLWGGLLRIFFANQMMYATNSVCHTFGGRLFEIRDRSKNNLLLAIPSIGLSLHNNHHAFPGTANNWFRWWHVDLSALLLIGCEKLGLVWDVRRVSALEVEEKRSLWERVNATR